MPKGTSCKTCGRPVVEDGLGGLCAACMMELVVESEIPERAPAGSSSMHILGYSLGEEIARGGIGIVYRAFQNEPQREVALKMLLPHQISSPGMIERFRLEARAVATLEHPAILPVHHVGEHKGLPFFTMKLANGGTLAQRKGEFAGNWRRIAELMAILADAVQFAHERGVLHRDLKPGNILFDEALRPYVSDFGLAKLTTAESDLTRSADLLGTPHYVAPEVAAHSAKEATTASDIYSLGAILYELLAGHPPFQAQGVPALLKKITEEEPSAIRKDPGSTGDVPRDLEIICRKCLAKEPTRRYGTAKELADDLRRWLEGRTILARAATPFERVQSWVRRNPSLAFMTAVLAVVLIVAVTWQARSNRRLQHALSESLLRQAQLERSRKQVGQRFETLALVSRAARPLRDHAGNSSNLVALRSEAVAALALPDLRLADRWRVHVHDLETEFDLSDDLDRFASPTPDGGFVVASTANRTVLYRGEGNTNNPVIKLRLHPNATWAAARFQDGHAELHALTSSNRSARRWLGVRDSGALFGFSRSGDLFAVVTVDGKGERIAEIIDLNSSITKARVPAANVTSLLFDPAGKHLALAGTEIAVWRLADTRKIWSAPLSHEASTLAWSPDGDRLAVALERRKPFGQHEFLKACPVILFNAATGAEVSTFGHFGSRVARMAFHPNSEWLVVATWDDGLTFGSTRWENVRFSAEGAHRALKFSRDGTRLGYAPTREELGLMEVAIPTGFRAWESDAGPEESFKLAISEDGKWAVTTSATKAHLWDATARVKIDSRDLPAKAIWVEPMFQISNQCIYVSAASFGVLRWTLTKADDGRLRFGEERTICGTNGFMAQRFTFDGRSLVVGDYRQRPPTMWLWPDADPTRARKLAEGIPMTGYRLVPNSRWAVTTSVLQSDVWIWDFENGQRLRNLGLDGRASAEPLANGRWLVARSREEFGVWEVGTWNRLTRWPARLDEGSLTMFSSPDGRLLATYNPAGRFLLRKLPGGEEVVLLTPPQSILIQNFQFTPDNTRLLFMSSNGEMFDWNLAEIRQELAKLGLDWADAR